jgi:hypothetical protein
MTKAKAKGIKKLTLDGLADADEEIDKAIAKAYEQGKIEAYEDVLKDYAEIYAGVDWKSRQRKEFIRKLEQRIKELRK